MWSVFERQLRYWQCWHYNSCRGLWSVNVFANLWKKMLHWFSPYSHHGWGLELRELSGDFRAVMPSSSGRHFHPTFHFCVDRFALDALGGAATFCKYKQSHVRDSCRGLWSVNFFTNLWKKCSTDFRSIFALLPPWLRAGIVRTVRGFLAVMPSSSGRHFQRFRCHGTAAGREMVRNVFDSHHFTPYPRRHLPILW